MFKAITCSDINSCPEAPLFYAQSNQKVDKHSVECSTYTEGSKHTVMISKTQIVHWNAAGTMWSARHGQASLKGAPLHFRVWVCAVSSTACAPPAQNIWNVLLWWLNSSIKLWTSKGPFVNSKQGSIQLAAHNTEFEQLCIFSQHR